MSRLFAGPQSLIPVSVLTGFLGSGKTTLLNHLVRSPEMARAQRVRALDLHALGVVDRVVAEKPDAATEPEEFCRRTGAVLAAELAGLLTRGPGAPADRAARYLGG